MSRTELADATIAALRTEHDALADLAQEMDEKVLSGPSGASDWTIAQVLSHLGSGAEISLRRLEGAQAGTSSASRFAQATWARWERMSPQEQRDEYIVRDGGFVERLGGLSASTRADLLLAAGFRPGTISLAGFTGLRFMEVVLHGWDVRAGLDASASLSPPLAGLMVQHLTSSELGGFPGLIAVTRGVREPIRLAVADSGLTLEIADIIRLTDEPVEPTARFGGAIEAFLRLLNGRLRPEYAPDDIVVTGNTDLDELRSIFLGY